MIFNVWKNWQKPAYRYHRPQFRFLIPIILLLAFGSVIQLFLEPSLSVTQEEVSGYRYFYRHLVAVLVGIIFFIVGYKLRLKRWLQLSALILLVGFILSLAAVYIGDADDKPWLDLGFISIQPVEILKLGFILLGAGYFYNAQKKIRGEKNFWKIFKANWVTLVLISLIGIVILILQEDYGSMFVLGMIFLGMFWFSGVSVRFLLTLMVAVSIIGLLFITTASYRQDRLIFLVDPTNPTIDCQSDKYYQICQAVIGTGSGGLRGRGFDGSVQLYGYLPEKNNDAIFVIFAETFGFIGAMTIISTLFLLLFFIYKITLKLEDSLKLVAGGILVWLSTQTILNIGGILSILPLTGITLPLISFGGSSLVLILLTLGILWQISAYTISKDERRDYQNSISRRRHRGSRHSAGRSE